MRVRVRVVWWTFRASWGIPARRSRQGCRSALDRVRLVGDDLMQARDLAVSDRELMLKRL